MGDTKRDIASTSGTAGVPTELAVATNQTLNALSHDETLELADNKRDEYEAVMQQFSQVDGSKDLLEVGLDPPSSTGAIEAAQMLHQKYRKRNEPYPLRESRFEEDLLNFDEEFKDGEMRNKLHGQTYTETDYLCGLSLIPPRAQTYGSELLDADAFQLDSIKAKPPKSRLVEDQQDGLSSQIAEGLRREQVGNDLSGIAGIASSYPFPFDIAAPSINPTQNKYGTEDQWPLTGEIRLPSHGNELEKAGKGCVEKSQNLSFGITGHAQSIPGNNQAISVSSGIDMRLAEAGVINSAAGHISTHGTSFEFSPVSPTPSQPAPYRGTEGNGELEKIGNMGRNVARKRSLGDGIGNMRTREEEDNAQWGLKKQKSNENDIVDAKSELERAEELRLRRIIRNRESARRSRQKSKTRFQEMERNFAQLKAENDALNNLVGSMLPACLPVGENGQNEVTRQSEAREL